MTHLGRDERVEDQIAEPSKVLFESLEELQDASNTL